MVQTFASPPRFLFGRKQLQTRVPPLVRHDVLVVAAGVLRAVDIALVPLTAFLAFTLRFGTLDIDISHVVAVPFGMVILANTMSLFQAYDHRELCSPRAQYGKVVAAWAA
ncbi:MAG TPA: hypothetical protein VFA22_11190, partial [Stellaceae bacterium]|nr:hypothetical protein [Stellaceae bacterium]